MITKYYIPLLIINLIFFTSIFNNTYAQHNEMKKESLITGKIITETTGLPVPFSFIVNQRTGIGKETDEDGQFKMHVSAGDSIMFRCMGYTDTVWVASGNNLQNDTLRLETQEKSYALNEVDVIWFRSYASFKYRVANLQIETDQPIALNLNIDFREIAAFQKTESGTFGNGFRINRSSSKSERRYQDLLQHQNLVARFNQITSQENLEAFTDLEGTRLDSFIVFLRSKHKINPTLPDYEILAAIQLVYEDFLAMNSDSIR